MSWPQHKNPRDNRRAKAPYNFVPLPEKVLYLSDTPDPEQSAIPTQDAYHAGRHTGWLECILTTETPLYVRCGLGSEQVGQVEAKDLPEFFYTDPDSFEPVIPGSSLRGMLRSLVEIVSYSKVQPVTNDLKVTFRAVAAPVEDPLSQSYKDALGKFGGNVKAGYLECRGDTWFICPALCPSTKEWYLKVKDKQIPEGAVPGLVRFRQDSYRPQYHNVRFDIEQRQSKRGLFMVAVNLGTGSSCGVLVCSGNMAESGQASSSKRKNYALVLEQDPRATTVPIPEQVVQDYVDSLTDFQKGQPPFDNRYGCLIEGRPVFYLEANQEVIAFGHTPNFRIPAWIVEQGKKRAAIPLDFVPEALRDSAQTDLAEALFGYVEPTKQDARPAARAGRVCVTDARLETGQGDVWLSDTPITPKILATPKPTTFQHYLVQAEPNDKKSLRHYGSPTPSETVIRGHKLYWHKPDLQQSDWEETPDKIKPAGDTQHTQIKPVREGIHFRFRIYFEDLDDRELGALLWILRLAADKGHRLKLGMGKPLGLGSVKVEATLHLTDRRQRYTVLFGESGWASGEQDDVAMAEQQAISRFEQWILQDPELNPNRIESFNDVERIQMLRFLLQWPGPDKEETRYLEIEHPQNDNEYKNRPVLPDPQGVMRAGVSTLQQQAAPTLQPTRASKPTPVAQPVRLETGKSQAEPVMVKHPTSVAEIREGDMLEGKVIAVDSDRIRLDFGIADVVGTMGLAQLDELVRKHPFFSEYWKPGQARLTAQDLQQEGDLEIALRNTAVHVQVRRVETKHGKTLVKVTLKQWLRGQ